MNAPKLTALVLAGQRLGGDALAQTFAVPHKAMLPLAGRPMGEWVIDALRGCSQIGSILVAGDTAPLLARNNVLPAASLPTIGETVEAVMDTVPLPLLITTIDHPLLTPAMIAEFLGRVPDCDCAVAVARTETVQGAYPEAKRTYLRFRSAQVTGCNLFLLSGPAARKVVRFWTRMDAQRKDPGAMVRALGFGSLMLWSLGLLTLDGAAQRLSRRLGVRLAVVEMSSAEAAIDVDKPEDVRLAERILLGR